MARPYVLITDSFKEFKDKVNTVSYNVGDPVNLTTAGDSDVVQAINEIDSDLHGAGGGNVKADLNYVAYQESVASGTVVGSLNAISSYIGDSASTLDVQATTIVGAINEIEAVFDASATEITSPSNFENYITGDWTVDASGDIILDAGGTDIFFKHGGTTRFNYNLGSTNEVDVAGDLVYDVSGDISLDADNGNIYLKDATVEFARFTNHEGQLDLFSGDSAAVRYTGTDQLWYGDISKASALTFDVEGDIILDASGGNTILKDGTTDRVNFAIGVNNTVTYTGTLTQAATSTVEHTSVGDFTIDATGDINLEANGEQVRIRKATTDRFTFNVDATPQLDINGNYTQAVTGFQYNTTSTYMKDSATTNYYLNANSGITTWTGGTHSLTSGVSTLSTAAHTHTASGNVQYNVTGNFDVDVSGDINLDVDGDDITFQQAGVTKFTYNLGANQEVDVAGTLTFDVETDINLDAGGNTITFKAAGADRLVHEMAAAGQTVTATGSYDLIAGETTLNASGNIIFDTDSDVYFKLGGSNKVSILLDSDQTLTAVNSLVVDAEEDIVLDADRGNVFIKDNGTTNFQFISGTNKEIDVPSGNLTLDVAGDINIDADGGNVYIKDAGTTNFEFISGTNKEIDVASGNLTLDVAGDIILDADGNDIQFKNGAGGDTVTHNLADTGKYTITAPQDVDIDAVGDIYLDAGGTDVFFQQAGSTKFTYNLGTNQEIDVVGNLTYDIAGDLTLDVDGGDIYLKDATTQFGRFQNANTNQLTVYSGTTAALTFTSNTATINSRALFTDSALATSANNVAGAINELDGQIDSADGKINAVVNQYIGGDGGNLNTLMSFFDSAGTKDHVIAALNHLGKFAVKVYDENGNVLNN